MPILWTRHRHLLAAGAGIALGTGIGFAKGALILTFLGFWMGLMWLLLLGGPIGLWVAARRQHAGWEAVALATGAAAGLAPWAWYTWYADLGLNRAEIWFPLALMLLAGLMLAPGYIMARESREHGPSPYRGARQSRRRRSSATNLS